MFEEILKEFLGTTKTFDDLFNEVFDNKVNTDDVSNKRNHSYFHSVKDKYKNGENVCHSEKEIEDGKVYRIATLDYLAEGNDHMTALKKAIKRHSLGMLIRDVMSESIIKNRVIDSKMEGRIIVQQP